MIIILDKSIKKIGDELMKLDEFRLPGKKALQPSDTIFEVVLIDATEKTIERLKKSNYSTIVEKRSGTPKKHS